MDKSLDQPVRGRAGGLCEYCHAPESFYPERFQIDHVIARQHGGPTEAENLALCCLTCNLRKGPNISSLDPADGRLVPLFHPRRDDWNEHFRWRGPSVAGTSPVGRATAALLVMNAPARLVVREALIEEGVFPPPGDAAEAAPG